MTKDNPKSKRYYVLAIVGVEIECHGPYRSSKAWDAAAREIHAKQDHECDSIFWASVRSNRSLKTGSYPSDFFDEE